MRQCELHKYQPRRMCQPRLGNFRRRVARVKLATCRLARWKYVHRLWCSALECISWLHFIYPLCKVILCILKRRRVYQLVEAKRAVFIFSALHAVTCARTFLTQWRAIKLHAIYIRKRDAALLSIGTSWRHFRAVSLGNNERKIL